VALARVWLAQERPEEVLLLLTSLLEAATRQQRWGNIIELRLLVALASQMHNEEQQALTQLSEAVRLAQPEGYTRSFVDEGAAMWKLLSSMRGSSRTENIPGGNVTTRYLDRVLAAFWPQTGADHRAAQHALPEPLSGREHEVLHLLAGGASNQEIAERLVITLDTVKRHVSNVLSKLGVSNRTQAVSRARELGLLSPERHNPLYGYAPSD
jgi:LuxR family maltose regulon positive regulatory protein